MLVSHRKPRKFTRKLLVALAFLFGLGAVGWVVWNPYPRTEARFDRSQNGLWVGHQWYTGRHVQTGTPVTEAERRAFEGLLDKQHIRDVFVHAGPIRADGTIQDHAGAFFQSLRQETPKQRFIPWIGGDTRHLRLRDPAWRASLIHTVLALRAEGFSGVHFDLEPVADGEPGYVELLRELREAAGPDFFISHATRRAGPFGWSRGPLRRQFWSEEFYRDTMAITDQTVLMAYDTTLESRKAYVGFVKHETNLLLGWAASYPRHHVMIGIPSYEDMPQVSDPRVENLGNASLGVRAALESHLGNHAQFDGVAVYAEWVTSPEEWLQFDQAWLSASPALSQ